MAGGGNNPVLPISRNAAKEKSYKEKLEDERGLYRRLMDHLDQIESSHAHRWRDFFTRVSKLLIFGGLVAALVCSLTVHPTNRKRLLRLRVWQWVTMSIMITSIMSVVPALTWALSLPFMLVFRTHKYWVYYLRKMKRSVDLMLWSCLVLSGWYVWFRPRLRHVHGELSVVASEQTTRLLVSLCVGSALWSIKNALYFKLEADLHYDQLFDRIRLSLVYLNGYWILEKPLDPDLSTLLSYRDQRLNIWLDVLEMKRKSVPIWILARLSREYLKRVKLITPQNADQLLNDDEQLLELAKKMFLKVKGIPPHQNHHIHQSDEIKRKDLLKYNLSVQELDRLFKPKQYEVMEEENNNNNNNQGVDKFLNWAVRVHKNCWGLEHILQSSKTAFVKLNRMLSAFLIVLVVIIWLILSSIVSTAQLALLFAPFLAASFMFENSSKNMFQGIIFTFAMHPFDVGDRVIVEDIQMRVKELNILTSVFYKYDSGAEVIFPNSKLATSKIVNLDITPDQSDELDFVIRSTTQIPQENTNAIDAPTPLENIKDLELKIQLLLDGNLRYASGTKVVKNSQDPEKQQELKMTVHFKYLVSYLNSDRKAEHKSEILSMIMSLQKEMEMDENHMREYPPHYKPYDIELTTQKVEMSCIQPLKRHILRSLNQYDCKVVLTSLKKKQIKMALYIEAKAEEELEPNLKTGIFFSQNLLRENGYTGLKVSRGERSIYQEKMAQAIKDGISQRGDSIAVAAAELTSTLPRTASASSKQNLNIGDRI